MLEWNSHTTYWNGNIDMNYRSGNSLKTYWSVNTHTIYWNGNSMHLAGVVIYTQITEAVIYIQIDGVAIINSSKDVRFIWVLMSLSNPYRSYHDR